LKISDHLVVLDYGRKIADGTPHQIRNDAAVIRAYLARMRRTKSRPRSRPISSKKGGCRRMLSIQGVHTFYGHIEALRGVDIEVKEGEIVTMIGANGAGKSTLLMTICGTPQAANGRIVFDGRDITRMPTHLIMRNGIAQSPRSRRIFPRLSVLENLQMGAAGVDPRRSSPKTWSRPSRSSRS